MPCAEHWQVAVGVAGLLGGCHCCPQAASASGLAGGSKAGKPAGQVDAGVLHGTVAEDSSRAEQEDRSDIDTEAAGIAAAAEGNSAAVVLGSARWAGCCAAG